MPTAHLLAVLAAVLLATRILGEAARRIGQPAVLGELVAGVILGASFLRILPYDDPVIHALAEIGVLVLLFEIGLETNLTALVRVGGAALTVALVGVAVPFAAGYWAMRRLGLPGIAAVVCGASLTATSIGISARVLSDLRRLDTPEGQVVLGAAVLDDIVGLIILSVVSALVSGAALSAVGIAGTTAVAVGFIAVALVAGQRLAPPIFRLVARLESSEGALGIVALAFAFMLAWAAASARSAIIIGAFAAGLVLYRTPQRREIARKVGTLGQFFVPIFFAAVGAAVDLRALADARAVEIGGALVVIAVLGKFVAGYAPWWFRGSKRVVGVAMIPRGEVGLIFAQMGLASGALDTQLFSAITVMVMISTLIAPPLLAFASRGPARAPLGPPVEDESPLDVLVAGDDEDDAPPDPVAATRPS